MVRLISSPLNIYNLFHFCLVLVIRRLESDTLLKMFSIYVKEKPYHVLYLHYTWLVFFFLSFFCDFPSSVIKILLYNKNDLFQSVCVVMGWCVLRAETILKEWENQMHKFPHRRHNLKRKWIM